MRFLIAASLAALGSAQVLSLTTGPGPYEYPPMIGLGTWQMFRENATEAVAKAIEQGYRHIDAAYIYFNQPAIGAGIREGMQRANITRKDLWVTSKLWNSRHGKAEYGLDETLRQLGLDYLDLFLMHWPMGNSTGKNSFDYVTAWKGMEGLIKSGEGRKVRNIGIANFSPSQLETLLEVATIKPLVHQFEMHPYLPQSTFLEDIQTKGILPMAYAPLANTNPAYKKWSLRSQKILSHPIITGIAELRGCTPAQVVLAWNLRRNVIVIPKAANPAHQAENIKADKCRITKQDDWEISSISGKAQFRMNGDVCTPEPMSNGCWEGLALGM